MDNQEVFNVFKFSEKLKIDSTETTKDDSTLEKEYTAEWLSTIESNDTRVAMIGNVDSGKSTLVGVMTNSCLDDGRGIARSMVLKHRHEQDNGRTSAVTLDIMGFKNFEQIVPTSRNHANRWAEIVEKSTNTVTLIDLCGHEKYLKTTLFGLTGFLPDFAFLIVGANMGVQPMTKEHISIACALNIPLFVAISKVDMCPPNILQNTRRTLAKVLRNCDRMPFPMKDISCVETALENISTSNTLNSHVTITPVFTISSVTGLGIDLLRYFLSHIKRNEKKYIDTQNDPDVHYDSMVPTVYFQVDGVYEVRGVGMIIGGTLRKGTLTVNDILYLGPDRNGHFIQIGVKSIECRRKSITDVKTGQSVTLAIRSINRKFTLQRNWFRRGIVACNVPAHASIQPVPRGIEIMPRAVR